ncbi:MULTISPECIES: membrane protein insertase YidC [Clostridium]|uniref:membrane protein insertase YidC n=1 Tax=Clostridium TaxID=1485 RepID=UPI00069FAB1C|nr:MULTISPECIES: membrane protein insertase YidC [Clostridium]KOF57524.1 protein translocase component YidC [Clostridium sp. DMHC 10]MCD2346887.1 membrane protein insertase YidC [Clostridium guangxiense]
MKIEFLNNLFVQFFNSINNVIFSVVPDKNYSYGLAIITLTILIKIVLIPLNIKMIKSNVGMTELQPIVKELQKKYKNDPQKLQQETMKLYKEKNVSPFGGCLPMLIQWPILVALYYVFYSLHIKGIGFLWISDLSQKATFSNWTTWILPILSGATTYFSGILLTPKNADAAQVKQSTTMNIGMSIMLLWMSWNFSAALVLYWVVSNIFQFAQTKVIMALVSKKPEESNIITESGVDKAVGVDSIESPKKKSKNKKQDKK